MSINTPSPIQEQTALSLLITDNGRQALVAATTSGSPVQITHIATGDGDWSNTAFNSAITALKSEKTRMEVSSKETGTTGQIHLTAIERSNDTYDITEIGVFLTDGTLFGIWSNDNKSIGRKSAGVDFLLTIDIILTDIEQGNITVDGNLSYAVPEATDSSTGLILSLIHI